MVRSHGVLLYEHICICICFHKHFISTDVGSGPLRAERRRREARREIFTTPGHVTARRSILGPPAEGRPGPSSGKKLEKGHFCSEKFHCKLSACATRLRKKLQYFFPKKGAGGGVKGRSEIFRKFIHFGIDRLP